MKVLFEYVDVDHDGNLDLLEFIECRPQSECLLQHGIIGEGRLSR